MAHCISIEAEDILDKEFPVLDKGFVRLIDYLGGDNRVVQAARVSYGAGEKTYGEDASLIDRLLRDRHTSPFEQVVLTFHIKLPIFVARQWIRHRTARVNEISARYTCLKNEFYVPAAHAFQSKEQPFDIEKANIIRQSLIDEQQRAYESYTAMLEQGVAKEIARINLPLSVYTQWYWQIDLHNLFNFLRLRLDKPAQKEIRDYASLILSITKKVAPLSCKSFESHLL